MTGSVEGLAIPRLTDCPSSLLTPHPSPSPQAYPPLVESRNPSAAGGRVFSGLSEEQWDHFMHSVRAQVHARLRSGLWKQASPAKGQPMMSCPRF